MFKKNEFSLKKLVLLALLVAINVVVSRIFIIPMPLTHGSVNLCDAIIFLVALSMGPVSGTIVGGLTGFLLDLFSGYGQFMFFSLIVHGLEGLVVGILQMVFPIKNGLFKRICASLAGVVVLVIGYFFTNTILYSWFAGLASIFSNSMQGIVGLVIAVILLPKIKILFAKFNF